MPVKRLLPAIAVATALTASAFANGLGSEDEKDRPADKDQAIAKAVATFTEPVRLTFEGEPIKVEAPGYASPCFADVDGDGSRELLVGQFSGGKIRVFKNLKDNDFSSSEWLKAGGSVATVPGVW